jgi:hypothetical protein
MSSPDFATTFLVDKTPKQVFDAITNVRGWWSEEIEGGTDHQRDVFSYRYKDTHRSRIKLIEVVPDTRVVWHILDNYFDFTEDKSEWKDTQVIFEVSKKGRKTRVSFRHQGLVPAYECFDVCSSAWGFYINSSRKNLITSGRGSPNREDH